VWGTAPSTGSLVCVGASRLLENYLLRREEHQTLGLCSAIGATLRVESNTRPPDSGVIA
jgi:hypothetical protein